MGAKVIIFDKILNSTFLKGLRHSALESHPLLENVGLLRKKLTPQRRCFFLVEVGGG